MHKYRLISKKGEGTFSEVLKAQYIKNHKYMAIKCMKAHFYNIEQVNNLREIQALKRLSPHPNIITLHEVLYDEPTGRLALVFELMDMNMYEAIKGRRHYLPEQRVRYYMYQVLKAIDHMHRNGIFHRDIKPENILIKDDQVKLADFGSCRGVYSKPPFTEYISTRWYRPPECLLTDGYYNQKMDYWGIGCVYFEVLALFPLFPGNNELDQVHKIHNILGTPSDELLQKFQKVASHMEFNFEKKEGTGIGKLIPNVSVDCREIITKLLIYNLDQRMSAGQALKHHYFKELRDADKQMGFQDQLPVAHLSGMMRLTNRGADSFSQNSKSLSKISDNASEGSYNPAADQKKVQKKHQLDKFRMTKQAQLGGATDLKIENSKTQTFHSDAEENYGAGAAHSSGVPSILGGVSGGMSVGGGPADGSIGGQQPGLPPIFLGQKNKGKKQPKGVGHSHSTQGGPPGVASPPTLSAFNSTKKNFPQLNKLKKPNPHHQYVSPYSIKSIQRP